MPVSVFEIFRNATPANSEGNLYYKKLFSGATNTRIRRHLTWKCLLHPFLVCFTKTPLQGSQTILFCILDESLDGITGGFYKVDCSQFLLFSCWPVVKL